MTNDIIYRLGTCASREQHLARLAIAGQAAWTWDRFTPSDVYKRSRPFGVRDHIVRAEIKDLLRRGTIRKAIDVIKNNPVRKDEFVVVEAKAWWP